MRSLLATIALLSGLLAAPLASAQTAGVPLQVRTGDVYTIRIEQTQSSGDGEQDVNSSFSQVMALRIVDAENRIWRYTPVSMNFSFPSEATEETPASRFDWAAVSEGLSALLRITNDVGFECRVNEFGACVELANWPLWRDRAENLVLMFDAFARAAPPPPEIAAEPRKSTLDETGEPEEAEAIPEPGPPPVNWLVLREPLLRGIARVLDGVEARDAASAVWAFQPPPSLQGRSLTRRQRMDIVEELELPFGAAPLRFTGTLQLQRIDRANNTAIIARRVALDSAAARASLLAMSQFVTSNVIEPVAASSPQGEAPPSGEALMGMLRNLLDTVDFSYEETGTGVVDLATGMVRETNTDFVITVSPSDGAGEGEPFSMRGHTMMRVTLGAPEIPRLPRGE